MVEQELAQVPLYLNWQFWSAIVAVLALALSQLPPIHILLRGARLDFEVYSRIALMHKIGNPHAQLHVILTNTGGREIRVRGLAVRIKRGSDEFVLPAENYLQTPDAKENVMLTSFRLKPGDEWGHIVNFLNYFSRDEEKHYRQLESDLRADIVVKRAALDDKNKVVAGDEQYVQPLLKFFDNKFRWHPGEYDLTLEIRAEPEAASVTNRYRFTLFESDSKQLTDYRDDYKYGFGVFLAATEHGGVVLPLTEAR